MIVYQRVCGAILIALLTAGPAVAEPASRNANVWDGVAHQPNPAIVHDQEKAAGFQPSSQEETKQDDVVERLARELLKQHRMAGPPRDGGAVPPRDGRPASGP